MKNLIIYATKHGTTEKCAKKLAAYLHGNTTLLNIDKEKLTDINNYDTVIVGGSIHASHIQKSIRKFCAVNLKYLTGKRLGIFICNMMEGNAAVYEFETAFSDELRERALAKGIFGGELIFEKMNFFERYITKRVKRIYDSKSTLNEHAIINFANVLNKE
jgi:menaquinone-dependent protoporphyrinogen oxidase